ncbi:uncharacterized protein BDW43DRAFT_281560 [Aspergillus alliaceus]|uniref:uncharacterized protein n=1 Tax=Petromyces alliaceus TaxID=209559 RepID=UPI0012A453E1|nr:uncharacterized protein BDW43DRAFT_281560 [Aspergillus alliaceus]KAB8231754.1 hypothetical protein BDW43DRAFT_281560 [Aspergillus alliaceus]
MDALQSISMVLFKYPLIPFTSSGVLLGCLAISLVSDKAAPILKIVHKACSLSSPTDLIMLLTVFWDHSRAPAIPS